MAPQSDVPTRSNIDRRRAAAAEAGGDAYRDRRSEIVDAAVALFRDRGYRRTSLAEIGEATGTERASLYYYFSSKEEILAEAVTPIVLHNTVVAEQLRDSDAPVTEKLRTLVVGLMTSYAEHYPLLFLYLEENLSHVSKGRAGWAAEMREVNRRYAAAIEAIVRQGVTAGVLRPLADPEIVANGLMGLVSWTHRWYRPERSSAQLADIGEAYAEILLRGLVDDGPRPADGSGWAEEAHPDVARVAARFAAAGVPRYDRIGVEKARRVLGNVVRMQAPEQPVAQVRDLLVAGGAGRLPARVYHPEPARALPVLVYVHGGGWALGGIREADRPCRRLAVESRHVVVSVEYRRSPETTFPGAFDDVVAAVRWVAENAAELGAHPDRIALAGDSAGGNLVAAATLALRDAGGPRIDAQVLVYPCLAPPRDGEFDSYARYADGPLMTRSEMDWFWENYLRSEADARDPRAAPLLAEDLAGLPRALVVAAELDPLRDEAIAYAGRLREAGVETELAVYRGAAHGFWWMDGEMRQAAELTAQMARFLSSKPS